MSVREWGHTTHGVVGRADEVAKGRRTHRVLDLDGVGGERRDQEDDLPIILLGGCGVERSGVK